MCNEGSVPGRVRLDPSVDELATDRLGDQGPPGSASGEEQFVVAAGACGLAASTQMGTDEFGERVRHLDPRGRENHQSTIAGTGVDLSCSHGADPRDGLGEKQHEQPGDPGVEGDRLVVQERVHVFPAVGVAHGDLRLARGPISRAETAIQASLAGPGQKLAEFIGIRFGLGDQVLFEIRLGGSFDAAAVVSVERGSLRVISHGIICSMEGS